MVKRANSFLGLVLALALLISCMLIPAIAEDGAGDSAELVNAIELENKKSAAEYLMVLGAGENCELRFLSEKAAQAGVTLIVDDTETALEVGQSTELFGCSVSAELQDGAVVISVEATEAAENGAFDVRVSRGSRTKCVLFVIRDAQARADVYTVTFANALNRHQLDPDTALEPATLLALRSPSTKGFVFLGWYYLNRAEDEHSATLETLPENEVPLLARWAKLPQSKRTATVEPTEGPLPEPTLAPPLPDPEPTEVPPLDPPVSTN